MALAKAGSGSLTLAGNNTFTGGTIHTGGTITLGSNGALGSTGVIAMNGGILQFTSANNTDYSSRLKFEDAKTATFDTNGQNVNFATTLSLGPGGTGSMDKTGSGILTISASNTYTGATSVSVGTLLVNGSLGNTTTTVASGATLGGTGTLAGDVTVNGIIAPGNLDSIGTLGLNSLDLADTMSIQWNGTTDSIDLLNISNLLKLRGTSTLAFSGLGGTLTQPAYVFANYGSLGGGFNQFGTITNLPDGYTVDYAYGTSMNQLALVTIPEPRTPMLGAIGLLVVLRRRRLSPLK